jgi:hypothetical protein
LRRLCALARDRAAWDTVGAQAADRGEGREVPEVIAAEQHGARRALRRERPQGGALVHAGGPELEHEPAWFDRECGALGEPLKRFPQQVKRRRRIRGTPRVDGNRGALILHCGSLGCGDRVEQPGECLAHSLDAGGHRGLAEHARLPALGTVVPEDDQARHLRQATERHRVRRGPPGDDRHCSDQASQPCQGGDAARRGDRRGRIIDDGGEGAVVVGSDKRMRWVGRQRGKAGPALQGPRVGQWHCYLVPGCGERMRWRRARCARSRLTSTGSNLSASALSISSLSSW